jgi:hypothetical protein
MTLGFMCTQPLSHQSGRMPIISCKMLVMLKEHWAHCKLVSEPNRLLLRLRGRRPWAPGQRWHARGSINDDFPFFRACGKWRKFARGSDLNSRTFGFDGQDVYDPSALSAPRPEAGTYLTDE